MRSVMFGMMGALVMSTAAMPADMPVKAPPAAVPVISNWTGFYVGVNAGYAWGRSDVTSAMTAPWSEPALGMCLPILPRSRMRVLEA